MQNSKRFDQPNGLELIVDAVHAVDSANLKVERLEAALGVARSAHSHA